MPSFEGSFLGDVSKLKDDDKLECKVCWWVYDPKLGDPDNNIEPDTPFRDLPDYWICPQCGCEKSLFMVIRDERSSK